MSEQTRKFTKSEVALHNGQNNSRVWVVIKNSVYDLTDYMEQHPGGSELISEYAGSNGTAAFDDFGHSSDAKNRMKLYKIGELVEENMSITTKMRNQQSIGNEKRPRRPFLRVICGRCGV